jgi:predicted phosphohydrolase
MVRIQIASDLHLEFYENTPQKQDFFETLVTPPVEKDSVDILILAGDIGYPEDKITEKFLGWCCGLWKKVVWIYGNHEYYNGSKNHYSMQVKEECGAVHAAFHKNLEFLQDEKIEIGDNLILAGCTFWTNLSSADKKLVQNSMNDFSQIWQGADERFSPDLWNELHWSSRAYLEDMLEGAANTRKKVIVVTHHLPSYRMILPQYQGHPANCGFAAKADTLLDHPCVAAWICGHSHGQHTVGKCHLNARGYKGETSNTTYNPAYIIEI